MIRSNLFLLFFLFSISSSAQYRIGLIPRVSPDKETMKRIGYTEIRISYGSPSVKGRDVWNQLAPPEQVWRAGANNATTISFSEDVRVEGQKLEKGTYALFVIPRINEKWTLIFSGKEKQWGAFRYKEEDDVLRVDVLPREEKFNEDLVYKIKSYGYEHGRVSLSWARKTVDFEIQTDYIGVLEQKISESAEQGDSVIQWVVYLQGADYLVNQNRNLDLASKWLDKSEKLSEITGAWNKQFYPRAYIKAHIVWTRAKLFSLKGKYNDAVKLGSEVKANVEFEFFYKRKQNDENIDALLEEWKGLAKGN